MTAESILIAENDSTLAESLRDALTTLGYQSLGPVSSGEEALTTVAATPPDLVLMGTRLGGIIDGFTAAQYIVACIDVPIVFVSIAPDPTELHRVSEIMPYGYLIQPVSETSLKTTLEIALQKHRLNRRLRENELRLTMALHGADLGMWDWDIRNDYITGNRRLTTMVGYLPEELEPLAKHWWSLMDSNDESRVRVVWRRHLENHTPSFESEYRVRHKDGHWLWVLCKGKVIERNSGGVPFRACGTVLDISDRKHLEEELRRVSITDPLTGAFNRRHFYGTIAVEINRSNRYHRPLSLIMFDIDHFKQINDRHGHERGDLVLKVIADTARKHKRASDVLIRWGGEEFMLLAPETTGPEASTAASRLRNALRDASFPDVGRVTASFGVSTYRRGEATDTLLNRVDALLYSAKEQGRDRIACDVEPNPSGQ